MNNWFMNLKLVFKNIFYYKKKLLLINIILNYYKF